MGRWYLRSTREAAQLSLFVAWESGGESADGDAPDKGLVLYVNPELHRLRELVDAARARLAELEAGFTVEKAQIGVLKERLFSRLRPQFQERDRLRLVVSYRRKYLETASVASTSTARPSVNSKTGCYSSTGRSKKAHSRSGIVTSAGWMISPSSTAAHCRGSAHHF